MTSPAWGYDGEYGKSSSVHVDQIIAYSLF